jgi:hypothetical protein
MEVSGQLHAPAALPPGKEPLVPVLKITVHILIGKRERKVTLWRFKRRWGDDI